MKRPAALVDAVSCIDNICDKTNTFTTNTCKFEQMIIGVITTYNAQKIKLSNWHEKTVGIHKVTVSIETKRDKLNNIIIHHIY